MKQTKTANAIHLLTKGRHLGTGKKIKDRPKKNENGRQDQREGGINTLTPKCTEERGNNGGQKGPESRVKKHTGRRGKKSQSPVRGGKEDL